MNQLNKIMDFLLTIGTRGIWSHLGCSGSRVGLHAQKFGVLKWSFSSRGLITNFDEHHNPFRMRVRPPPPSGFRLYFESKKRTLVYWMRRGVLFIVINHKNYNFLNCDWFKKLLFPTNSPVWLLSDTLLSDSSTSQSHSKLQIKSTNHI